MPADILAMIEGEREQAFWARVERGESCWTWKGTRNAQGYGRFYVASRTRRPAHRLRQEALALAARQLGGE